MEYGIRHSGFGKAGGMKLAVSRRSVRAPFLPSPHSLFPALNSQTAGHPGSARNRP
jgi:hypothetical protein